MKNVLFVGLLIFSLVVNVAVVATLVWHKWSQPSELSLPENGKTEISRGEVRRMIMRHHGRRGPGHMRKYRRAAREKYSELLDTIAENPGRPDLAKKQFEELMALRARAEYQALERIGSVMAELPEHQKKKFLRFLKRRGHRGPMGMRRGPCPTCGRGGPRMRRFQGQ
ncbi:hypothetical protein ACFL2Q_10105 [Thermodesulfobacteriota bacterium]